MLTDLIFGRHPVLEALRAGESVVELRVAKGAQVQGPLGEILRRAREAAVTVRWVPRVALDRALAEAGSVASGREPPPNHQGVIALVEGFSYSDPAEILAEAIRAAELPLVLVLDQIQDVNNLGNLMRTAVAVGAHGLVIPDRKAVSVTAAVRKASAGAVAHVRVARSDVVVALEMLREHDLRLVGLDASGETEYTQADLSGPLALVVGGEVRGLRPSVTRRCDCLVRLPMLGPIESLNAGVAGSIVLYEALRQRGQAALATGPR